MKKYHDFFEWWHFSCAGGRLCDIQTNDEMPVARWEECGWIFVNADVRERGEHDDSIAFCVRQRHGSAITLIFMSIHFERAERGKNQQQRWRNHSFENAKINKTNDTRFVIVLLFSPSSDTEQPCMEISNLLWHLFATPATVLLRHNSYFKVIFPSITIEHLKPSCSPSKTDKKKEQNFFSPRF